MLKTEYDSLEENLVIDRRTSERTDYSTVIDVNGLVPFQPYEYRLSINDIMIDSTWHFETLPVQGESGIFEVGFGGCAAYHPAYERIWDNIRRHKLQTFFILGDNVYIDHPELPDVQRFCYYQRQSVPSFRRFTAETPFVSIWDDHDFGVNDSFGTSSLFVPAWKNDVLSIFKENFANPYYATEDLPGIWYDYWIGDVQFLMLDCRYYRQPSTDEQPSMLGQDQLDWLKKSLAETEATFKVITSSVAWSDFAKGLMEGRIDTWEGYPGERKEIFDFIKEKKIDGVVLLSADRHRHDVWKHDREDAYAIYEFTSSRLTNIHYHALMPDAIAGYNEKNGFAKLTFNTEVDQPYMVYQVFDIDDELILQMRIYLHQLTDRIHDMIEH